MMTAEMLPDGGKRNIYRLPGQRLGCRRLEATDLKLMAPCRDPLRTLYVVGLYISLHVQVPDAIVCRKVEPAHQLQLPAPAQKETRIVGHELDP